jgi:uncharacterized repeat protein (TIGR03803 family)
MPADLPYRKSRSASQVEIRGGNMRGVFSLVVLSVLVWAAVPRAHGQTEALLYNFCAQPECIDGVGPAASLLPDGAGNFYGTTQLGGEKGYGTIFELSPNGFGGYNESVLYSFCSLAKCADGTNPDSSVTFDSNGNLYGTTYYGGQTASGPDSGYGVVFELSPSQNGCPAGSNPGKGWCETVLHNFLSNPDGAFPFSALTWDSSGNLYGTTVGGGSGAGTTYELSPNGLGNWKEKVIYERGGYAGLAIDASGNLYGADYVKNGHVFELTSNGSGGWKAIVLHTFKGGRNDGAYPEGTPVFDSAGNLYGTTHAGGTMGAGTVWKMTPTTGDEYALQILYSFIWENGSNPYAGVTLDGSGNIYGVTGIGIIKSVCYAGCGNVFELAADGTAYTWKNLWPFNDTDGGYPSGSLLLMGGNLYGTTYGGGSSSGCGSGGCGVVFELVP